MSTKRIFIKRYNQVKEDLIESMDLALERAIGNECIDFDKGFGDFRDVYPLIGAVLQKELHNCLEGSSYKSTIRQQKRQATAYRNDFRIWTNYAGDYKDKR